MNEKMKVLWFSGALFSGDKPSATGTWLHGMSRALVDSGRVELYNLTNAKVPEITRQDCGEIRQWIIPYKPLGKNGLPDEATVRAIQDIVSEVQPDIVHVWGTEAYWGLLPARGIVPGKFIVEIQGLLYIWEKYFFYGMKLRDILGCVAPKDFLHPSLSIFGFQRKFRNWGLYELEIIRKSRNISTQSEWTRSNIRLANPDATIFSTQRSLRHEFLESARWSSSLCKPHSIFTSTSSSMSSYKGLHVLVDAMALLKDKYPDIHLNIGGFVMKGLRFEDGYTRWLKRKIRKYGLQKNITWLGPVNAPQIIEQMHASNAVVIPSFIESYCLALAEALTVGVPTVVSFSGAMPELAKHEESALYFPPGDAVVCAAHLERLFNEKELAERISESAYLSRREKTPANSAERQLEIYQEVINQTL